MNTKNLKADKTQENKSQPGVNTVSQKPAGEPALQFFDARHELKEMANNSSQVKQLRAVQKMADNHSARQHPIQKKENKNGLPDNLKSGIENLSGYSMDNVKVHYNSDKPAQMQAHAFTQGTNIHIASGQEKNLPHEAWHVVQQMQGRVQPTMQMKDRVPVNDDAGLEHEADAMGARALQTMQGQKAKLDSVVSNPATSRPVAQLRTLKMGKKKLANLPNAVKTKEFVNAITPYYQTYTEARVKAIASQLFSAEGEDFESLEQFVIELEYDLGTKSVGKEALTLQEQYMTEYGWRRAAAARRPAIQGAVQKLKLYRTMSVADWKKLDAGDHTVLQGGHIGDFKQALKYFLGESKDSKVMVEFTLKAGSEQTLFSPTLALPKADERTAKLEIMATAMGDGEFPVCNTAEGTSSEAIGIKSESEGEAGFSIGIGGGDTSATFMALVESVALKPVGDKFSKEPGKQAESGKRVEADANLLLGVNNCLINAIAMAALNRVATLPELIAIRGAMNNYGEMLVASPAVVALIQQTLHIAAPITVNYQGAVPAEDFDGVGEPVHVYHVNGNHFTHELED